MSNLAQNETYKELRAQRDTARDRLAHLRNLVQNVIGAERRRADLAEQHANDAIAHAEDMQRSRDACRTALANQIQQLATCQAALAIAQGAAAPGGIPPAAGGYPRRPPQISSRVASCLRVAPCIGKPKGLRQVFRKISSGDGRATAI